MDTNNTENAARAIYSQAFRHRDTQMRFADKLTSARRIAAKLAEMAETMAKDLQMEYTGWAVLLKQKLAGWECVRTVNLQNLPDEELEFDLLLPIPKPECVAEFMGF
jgi:hypothetical protein